MKKYSVAALGRGRMGLLVQKVLEESGYQFAGFITAKTKPAEVENMAVDVVVDFSIPEAIEEWLPEIVRSGAALVTGTTGLNDTQQKKIESAASVIPILQASNFSIGISRVKSLVRTLSESIGKDCEIEIIEKHHNQKVDAPSGTAIDLAQTAVKELGAKWNWSAAYPVSGKRLKHTIQIHALRGGNIPGEHEILFVLPNEVISIKHSALNRTIFAEGAVHCIDFIMQQNNGLFTLEDTFKKEL